MNNPSKQEKTVIRKLQGVLCAVENGQFGVLTGVYNITQMQSRGLIKGRAVNVDSMGERKRVNMHWYLTPKAKQFLAVHI